MRSGRSVGQDGYPGGTDALMYCSRCGLRISVGYRVVGAADLDGEAPFVCDGCLEPEDIWEPANEADYLGWAMDRLRASTESVLRDHERARHVLMEERRRGREEGIVDITQARLVRRKLAALSEAAAELDEMRRQLVPILAGRRVLRPEHLEWNRLAGERFREMLPAHRVS